MKPCIFVRLLGWLGWGCNARKLEMGVGHYMFQILCESNDGGRHGLFESGLWSIFPWQKLPSGERWYALKCVTPGVCAWSHRSSINISIKIKHVQQYISSSCIIYHHDHHISRLNISYHIIKQKTYIIMVIIYHVSYIIMIIICHHHWSCIMYLGYVSSKIVILVGIEITINKVITASIIKVVTKDGCVFKMWVVLGSQCWVVSHIELLRS